MRLPLAALTAATLALTAAIVLDRPGPDEMAIAARAVPSSPYDRAVTTLREQSAALLSGDEQAWLAAVDTPLRGRYRSLFRSLRTLDVTRFDYHPGDAQPVDGDPAAVILPVEVAYCLGTDMCPAVTGKGRQAPPRIEQRLTVRPIGGRYVITSAVRDGNDRTPWEDGDLIALRGTRVTVLAAPAQRHLLAEVLPVAEEAARSVDRFAALSGAPQSRYRVYLAGEKQWRSWYGGQEARWAIGLAIPLNTYGIDVLLRMAELEDDPVLLRVALRHELGHVVTLSGASRAGAAEDSWLSEGVAEYIGWSPGRSRRLSSVRSVLDGSSPRSMVPVRPARTASSRAGDAFYGLSHLAVGCMAAKYGEARLFTFVRLVLTRDAGYDEAAEQAYGVSFAELDRTCVPWIRGRVL